MRNKPIQDSRSHSHSEFFVSNIVIIVFCLGIFGTLIDAVLLRDIGIVHFVALAIFFYALAMIYSVRVYVEQGTLARDYGVGVFSREFDVSTIESLDIVKNRHFFCWIYTPLVEYCVLVRFRGGGKIYLPAQDAKQLASALKIKI